MKITKKKIKINLLLSIPISKKNAGKKKIMSLFVI